VSSITEIDLTQFGCPVHYLKAREALKLVNVGDQIYLLVNNGDAVTDVMNSLLHDGQLCEIEQQDVLITKLKVIKKSNGRNK
jgi:TusA-related sulfurtransferase